MKTEQAVTDKLAIGLSVACAIHCLFLPLMVLNAAEYRGIEP